MKRWVAGVAAVALLGGGGTALAAKTFETKVGQINYSLGFFNGNVNSKLEPCEVKRGVDLYEDSAATPDTLRDNKLGTDRTDNEGDWSLVDSDGTGGTYVAVADEKKGTFKKKNGKKVSYVCAEDESQPFTR